MFAKRLSLPCLGILRRKSSSSRALGSEPLASPSFWPSTRGCPERGARLCTQGPGPFLSLSRDCSSVCSAFLTFSLWRTSTQPSGTSPGSLPPTLPGPKGGASSFLLHPGNISAVAILLCYLGLEGEELLHLPPPRASSRCSTSTLLPPQGQAEGLLRKNLGEWMWGERNGRTECKTEEEERRKYGFLQDICKPLMLPHQLEPTPASENEEARRNPSI